MTTSAAVIGALHDLHDRGSWPTPVEVASYLKLEQRVVDVALAEFKDKRLFRPRRRDGLTVWMPWNAV
jgi:hypothetical protein